MIFFDVGDLMSEDIRKLGLVIDKGKQARRNINRAGG